MTNFDLLDVPIDKSKAIFWPTRATDRQALKASDRVVSYWTRDLGGHIQYSRQMTNSVITRKIEKCSDQNGKTWPIQRPRIAAWPNMLHGIASGFLGANHFDDMRTNALKALGDHRPGTSHCLHLSLVNHPSADPALYAPILTDASRSHSRVQKPGPGHLLLTRLHQLHWHLNMHDTCRDENGDPIDLWHAPVQEVYMRVCEAWQAQVAGCIAKRKNLWTAACCATI